MDVRESSSPTEPIHTYRWPWRWRLLIAASVGARLLAVSASIVLLVIVLDWMLVEGESRLFRSPFPALTGLALLVLLGLWVVYAANLAGGLFLTTLSLSTEGLEYRAWPGVGVRCTWREVEHLGPHAPPGLPTSDALFLRGGETFGWPVQMNYRRWLGLDTQHIIPLGGLPGWPEGPLAADLRRYAPHLFRRRLT